MHRIAWRPTWLRIGKPHAYTSTTRSLRHETAGTKDRHLHCEKTARRRGAGGRTSIPVVASADRGPRQRRNPAAARRVQSARRRRATTGAPKNREDARSRKLVAAASTSARPIVLRQSRVHRRQNQHAVRERASGGLRSLGLRSLHIPRPGSRRRARRGLQACEPSETWLPNSRR